MQVFVAGAEYKGPNSRESRRRKQASQKPAVSPSPFSTPFSADAQRSFDYGCSSPEEGTSPNVGCLCTLQRHALVQLINKQKCVLSFCPT